MRFTLFPRDVCCHNKRHRYHHGLWVILVIYFGVISCDCLSLGSNFMRRNVRHVPIRSVDYNSMIMSFGDDSFIAFQQDNQSRDDVPSKEEEEKRPSSSKSSIKQKTNSVISSGGNKDDVTNNMLARMLYEESFILQSTTKDHSSPPSPWIISATNSRPNKRRAFRYQTDDDSPDRLPISSSSYTLGSINSLTEDMRESITARHPVYHTNHRSSDGDGSNNKGWTPGEFPNPMENPRLCGLSSFLDQTHPQPKESSKSALNKTVLSSSSSLYPFLCDPDDMLGNTKREKIACAIDKFAATGCSREFARTSASPCASTSSGFGGGDNDEEGELHEDGVPVPTSDDVTVTASSGDGVFMDDFSISSDKIDVKRGKGTPGKPSLSPSTDTKEVGGGGEDFTMSPPIQVAVAVVKKINVQEIVAYNSFLNYQDQEDIVNDAAQYFARYIHETWQVGSSASSPSCPGQPHPHSGVLIFLSIQDRVCFISTSGSLVESVLPWWRLEQIMMDIQNELRHRDYGTGILHAIADIHDYLRLGPPTASDRIWDIISRFGVVIGFSLLAFSFAVWGEYRDRYRRWQYTEKQSKLNKKEFIVAKSLQVEYECYTCPICLEDFSYPEEKKPEKKELLHKNKNKFMKKTSYGSLMDNYEDAMQHSNTTATRPPSIGSDGLPLKLLRCGHAFDETCWKLWVNKGTGDPCKCPVCRCDIGPKNDNNCGRAPPTAPTPPAAITTNATIHNNNNDDVVSGNNTVPVPHPGYDTVHQTNNAWRMRRRRRERSFRFLQFNFPNIPQEVLPPPISPPHATDEETHGLLNHNHQPLETIVFSTSGSDGDTEENRIDDADGLTIDDRTNEYDVQIFSGDDSHSESNTSLESLDVERLGHTDV